MAFSSSLAGIRPLGGFKEDTNSAFGASGSSRARTAAPRPPPLDLPALQHASRALQEQFIKDVQSVPDLGDMLTIPGGQSSASYTVFPGDYRVPFQKRKHIGIPPVLWEHFQSSKFVCHMGVIPEVERAWITLDHKLFLWDYVEGQELSSFIDQPEVITHVALVQPKPGVFIDEITALLVICTPVTVILLGLSCQPITGPDNRTHKEIKLYATDMSIATDGIEMSSVAGTSDGRIFMCGLGDGNLYELHYQEKEVWFGKRFHLINHTASGVPSFIPLLRTSQNEERIISLIADRARGYLYSLSENNWVSIWKLEPNKGLRKVQTLSNLHKLALDKAPGAPALAQGLKLLSIHVVDQRESKSGVQLMALSSNGVRLYFSPAPSGYGYGYGSGAYGLSSDGRQLQLVHVRLPPINLLHPDEQLQSRTRLPGAVHNQPSVPQPNGRSCVVSNLLASMYADGLLVAAQPSDVDGKDFILGISPDLSKIGSLSPTHASAAPQSQAALYGSVANQRPPLTEQGALLYVEGTIWAIARSTVQSRSYGTTPSPEPFATNELATQFSEPHQEFVIVTNVGISFLVKRRVLDYLKDALEEVNMEGSIQPLIEFRESYGRDQTCAMLLALASGNTFLSTERSNFSVYNEVVNLNPDIATVAKQAFYDLGDRPIWVDRGYAAGDGQGNVIFSGRREGLALYVARLVRPIWRAKITKTGPNGQIANLADSVLVNVQRNLYALKVFLDRNAQLFVSAPGEQVGTRHNNEQDAWKIENGSYSQLHSLLTRTVEALSFVLLLIDYHVEDLTAQCDKDTQTMLSNMTFEELITTQNGLHVSRMLVNVIINRQIGQQISIDTVSEILQQRCGSFCSADDVMLYKAQENVRKASDLRDPNEKQNVLGESLRLYTRAAAVISFERLREICGDFQHLNYSKGAVELPLACAAAVDPDNVTAEIWAAGAASGDPSKLELLTKRLNCYDLVLDSLSVFDEQVAKNQLLQGTEDVRNRAYDVAFSSEDALFHSRLYDWMVGKGMADALLEIRPPFLESHLLREPMSADKYQLLWQLYVKNGQYLKAAEVLAALAQSSELNVPLESRLEYLTLAVSNAKSHPVSAGGRHENAIAFLTELEDQLEVAQVQMELYHILRGRIGEPGEVGQKVQALQGRLFNITELYQFYAEPFDLPSIKLFILHVSDHRDEAVVRPIWNEIMDEAERDGAPDQQADKIASAVISYGRRFYPSDSAFPLRYVSTLVVKFALTNKGVRPSGWAPRLFKECGVPYPEIWDVFHEMYEAQVPPFNEQENVQAISSDIANLLKDWVDDARNPQSLASRGDFPVDLLDRTIGKYLEELSPDRKESRSIFEDVKRQLRRYW